MAIEETGKVLTDVNLQSNTTHIYIARKADAGNVRFPWTKGTYDEIHWKQYQIKETDMRTKTASFTTPQYMDLTQGVYVILITSNGHEDFGGLLLNASYDEDTGVYEYQCQDYSRYYQSKLDLVNNGKFTNYKIIQYLLTKGELSLTKKATKSVLKKYKNVLSGLLPMYQYDQKYWGKKKHYNPFEWKEKLIIRNKSYLEAIRDIVYGTYMFVDVHFDKYGTLQLEPYISDEHYHSGLYIQKKETINRQFKFDTTNIITGVIVHSTDKLKDGNRYYSGELVNLELDAFFGPLTTSVDNPNQSTSKSKKADPKKSQDTANEDNPYGTKKKTVYISTDHIGSASTDNKFMNDFAKILQKNGWKTKIVGRGPNSHYNCNVKNGIWFCIYGGADAGLLKETATKSAYRNNVDKLGSRTVIGFKKTGDGPPCDIRKGGKCYEWLKRSSDNRPGFPGLKYPSKVLIKGKVPFMYAGNASEMAAKFLKGGDEPNAL